MKKAISLIAASVLIVLAGCSAQNDKQSTSTQSAPNKSEQSTSASHERPIVFAAASLSKLLPQLSEDAEYSFDGSSGLVDQIVGGAPADIFLSANKKNMDRAIKEGVIDGEPVMFATNYLVLITPKGNPAGITGFNSSLNGVKLVICQVEVPCGAATQKLSKSQGVALTPVSEETKVTDVLGKVLSGEADAGLVYATDATGKDVDIIEIPGAKEDPNTYWAAVVKGAKNADAGRAFIAQLVGEWQPKLAEAGFGAPVK